MEKRSRRRVPDLVARPAFQGLSENEIGRARISMMARNTAFHSRAGCRSARPITSKSSNLTCNARPVHTVVPFAEVVSQHCRALAGPHVAQQSGQPPPVVS